MTFDGPAFYIPLHIVDSCYTSQYGKILVQLPRNGEKDAYLPWQAAAASSSKTDHELLIRDPAPDIDPKSQDVVDIVAVHGPGGDSITSWTFNQGDGKRAVNWLTDDDMLPRILPNARIMRFGYPSVTPLSLESWKGSISDSSALTDELLSRLHAVRADYPYRPIIFIGHGLGSLIVKKAVITIKPFAKQLHSLAGVTAGIAFFGSSHISTSSALPTTPVLGTYNKYSSSNRGLIASLKPQSQQVWEEENSDFLVAVNSQSIPVRSFNGTEIAVKLVCVETFCVESTS